MADSQYRVRTGTEILDAAFQLVKANYPPFLTITAIGCLPLLAFGAVLFPAANDPSLWLRSGIFVVILGLLSYVASIFMFYALIRAAADAYHGRPINIADTFRMGFRTGKNLAVLNFVLTLLIGVGMILLIVPGFLIVSLVFVAPVLVVLEDMEVIPAIKRSSKLCGDHKLRIIGFAFVLGLVYLIGGVVAVFVGLVSHSFLLREGLNVIVRMFLFPLIPAVMVLQYYDARIEKEGYDVEMLAGESAPAAAPRMAVE